MRILHVIGDLNIGGAEKLLIELIPFQCLAGHKVSLLILGPYNKEFVAILKNKKIDVITLNIKNIYLFINFIFLSKYMNNYDVVHVHLFPALYFSSILKLFIPSSNLIYTEHSTHNKRRKKLYLKYLERFIYAQYSKVICISDEVRDNLLEWLYGTHITNKMLQKYHVIYNGVDLKSFKNVIPAKLGIVNKKIIMMVSRFSIQKDHATLISAFAKIFSKNNNIHLVFVGDGVSRKEMEQLTCTLGLSEAVLFLGARYDVPNLMKCAYIGVQSSRWEGFGLTALEFMASGIPIIASDVPGLNNVVKDGGLLFPQGNDEELAQMINQLLSDKTLYDSFIQKGIKKAKQYSIESTASLYIDLYKKISR
jgi:glycosyltransferase involved in cell wall biosynthesis